MQEVGLREFGVNFQGQGVHSACRSGRLETSPPIYQETGRNKRQDCQDSAHGRETVYTVPRNKLPSYDCLGKRHQFTVLESIITNVIRPEIGHDLLEVKCLHQE